ncbi:hypothetical protein LJY25_11115 [Hymenobacter sp. BT175]|uniref:hypothetical protein n=1 Tax=Hymenobacter translucens TaxID=2886507 RepID=UPI001D0E8F50|nr:hypothetical protein [Hymenobacter translucens]MCC2546997.1 hypothetical protein [Hymenobacter translucens]
MKKTLFALALLASSMLGFSSCTDQDKLPAPETEDLPILFPRVTPGKDYFPISQSAAAPNSNPTRPVFEFTIDPGDQREVEIDRIAVYRSYRRGTQISPRLLVKEVSSFPATITMNSDEALRDLERINGAALTTVYPIKPGSTTKEQDPTRTNNFLVRNDAIVFTFDYILKDGRRIVLTPLTGTFPSPSGTLSREPFAAVAVFR